MEKMKIGIYCYFIADILTKLLQKSLSGPLPNISFVLKRLNLIGCHGNRKTNFAKNYYKINSLEAVKEIKLNCL